MSTRLLRHPSRRLIRPLTGIKIMTDYDRWKRWWLAVLYGMGQERRMKLP